VRGEVDRRSAAQQRERVRHVLARGHVELDDLERRSPRLPFEEGGPDVPVGTSVRISCSSSIA
jgi:hypothetical protein